MMSLLAYVIGVVELIFLCNIVFSVIVSMGESQGYLGFSMVTLPTTQGFPFICNYLKIFYIGLNN